MNKKYYVIFDPVQLTGGLYTENEKNDIVDNSNYPGWLIIQEVKNKDVGFYVLDKIRKEYEHLK